MGTATGERVWRRWERRRLFDETGFFESGVGTVFGDRLEGARGEFHFDVLVELRHLDALGTQVGGDVPLDDFGHVATDATLFLGETTAVDFSSATRAGSGDAADSGHGISENR